MAENSSPGGENNPALPEYFAFLRAINLGGHRQVKMADLRKCLEEEGLEAVETFIASGNVRFQSAEKLTEGDLEKLFKSVFGFEIDTFLRTPPQVRAVVEEEPFGQDPDGKIHVAFLKKAPSAAAREKLLARDEDLAVVGREVYWRLAGPMSDSKFSGAALEKIVDGPATMRNRHTLERMVKRYV